MRALWVSGYQIAGAARELRRHATRSLLAVCCVALGTAGAIASANYVLAGRQRLLGQIEQLGTNVIAVSPRQTRNTGNRARTGRPARTLREDDYRAIRSRVDGIARASGLTLVMGRLNAKGFAKSSAVNGCEPDFFRIKAWPLLAGTQFGDAEVRRSARVAVLGFTAATELFGTTDVVGERLFINRVPFDIIGVLTERGAGRDLSEEDKQVYVPLTTAMRRLQNVDDFSGLLLEVAPDRSMETVVAAVTAVLTDRHRVSSARPADFTVQNQQALIEQQLEASERLAIFVRWINLSSLVMSGCGVLTIMWITVRNRITEVGTRRAIGATAMDVFRQFATESLIVAVAGCAMGVGLGWVATRVVLTRSQLPLVFDGSGALVAALTAATLSVIFGALPAWRAARMPPARALASQ